MDSSKILTVAIPCYNSSEYMDHAIESVLEGSNYAQDIEIVIVNDGSAKDNTADKADEWVAKLPTIIRAIHKENGGHGSAVMAGLHEARGKYFKVLDSDDWLDESALASVLATLRVLVAEGKPVDLFITNYVYEHAAEKTAKVIRYKHIIPEGRVIEWERTRRFPPQDNLLMHALIYRTQVLVDGGLDLPSNTFYVDNIYAYLPLPWCHEIYYSNVDLYRYYIGRDDQSVNEQVMVTRIDQQIRVTRWMMNHVHLYNVEEVPSYRLRMYMIDYFILMMVICDVFTKLAGTQEARDDLKSLWAELKEFDPRLYKRVRYSIWGMFMNLKGRSGKRVTIGSYRIAKKLIKFN